MNCTAVERVLVVSVLQPEHELTQLGALCVKLRIPERVVPQEFAGQRVLPFEHVPVRQGPGSFIGSILTAAIADELYRRPAVLADLPLDAV